MKQKSKFKKTEIGTIPEDWEVEYLDSLCGISSSKRIFLKEYVNEGIPFYRSKEIILLSQNQEINAPLFISKEKFDEISLKYGAPKEGDLLMTSVGTLGVPYIIRKNQIFYFKDGNLMWFKSFEDRLLNRYLFYWIKSPLGQQQLDSIAIGSTQKALTIDSLKRTKLPLPSLCEQKAIAKILSSLDDKIELNQQMNKTLESIAQAIFKHWFIDFEFPNEEGKPYKSSGGEMIESELGKIPNNWKVEKLGQFIQVIKGCSYKSEDLKESNKALVTLKSIDRGGGFNQNGYKEYVGNYKEEQVVKDGEIVVAQTDLTQNAEVIGTPAIINSLNRYEKLIASLDLQILRIEDKLNIGFLYFLLKTDTFHNHTLSYTNGTTVLHLNKSAVPNFEFIIPTDTILNQYGQIANKIIEKMNRNEKEVFVLSQIRDALLPKLMSGKIRVNTI